MAFTRSISSVARTSASLQRLMVRSVRLAALSSSSTRMRSAISASSLSSVELRAASRACLLVKRAGCPPSLSLRFQRDGTARTSGMNRQEREAKSTIMSLSAEQRNHTDVYGADVFVGRSPRASAARTRSAKDRTPIFLIR